MRYTCFSGDVLVCQRFVTEQLQFFGCGNMQDVQARSGNLCSSVRNVIDKQLRYCCFLSHEQVTVVLVEVSGRTFVYVMLYVVFSMFLLGLLPHIFSIPNIGSGWDIVTMMIPFLLATSFFALAVSRWFTDSEAPLLMIAFFSVGYIFLSGVSYPLELMPWYWQAAHYVFPVAPAVLAFVKLNSMGGSLADIWPQMLTLWIQVIIYGAWAVYALQ